MLLTIYGTEWPILCWCAVNKLLTDAIMSCACFMSAVTCWISFRWRYFVHLAVSLFRFITFIYYFFCPLFIYLGHCFVSLLVFIFVLVIYVFLSLFQFIFLFIFGLVMFIICTVCFHLRSFYRLTSLYYRLVVTSVLIIVVFSYPLLLLIAISESDVCKLWLWAFCNSRW